MYTPIVDLDGIVKGFQVLWENKPGAVVLLILGIFVFLFLVVDAWRHKHRRRRPKGEWRP